MNKQICLLCLFIFTEFQDQVSSSSSCHQVTIQIQICGQTSKHFLLKMMWNNDTVKQK